MITMPDGVTVTETKEELVEKYFGGFSSYTIGHMAVITLLSDLQHAISPEFGPLVEPRKQEYWRQVLNDVKCVLSAETKRDVRRNPFYGRRSR